ncbi:YtxH domain-containing protein [Bacillus fonticola]|uniref:YtxH domain-containing protein n=1 Tax=Bacillus fonticola TaxID=2728853 RepID=UPI0014761C0E|nr:YtxH domain-containing protein [Bacillus fonticola]
MGKKSLWVGLLAGGAIGSIATLLTTPNSGKVLIQQIRQQAFEWKALLSDSKTSFQEVTRGVKTLTTESKQALSQFVGEVRTSVEDWHEHTNPHMTNIEEEVEQIQRTLAQLEASVSKKT